MRKEKNVHNKIKWEILHYILYDIIRSVFFRIKKTKINNSDINTILIPEMDTGS